jgi:two-component system, chemotaxis family, chemotaxis protein CheY
MNDVSTPLTICLIDDDRIYQFTAKRIIELVNPSQKVLGFFNGQEAIDYFRQPSLTNNDLPDVIFLDINMPVMNGWEFLEAYEAVKGNFKKDIIIYMVSSSIDDKDRSRAETFTSVKDYIEKPVNQQMMRDILNASRSTTT